MNRTITLLIVALMLTNNASANTKEEQEVASLSMDMFFAQYKSQPMKKGVDALAKLKSLANQGEPYAQASLCELYTRGNVFLRKDLQQAMVWCQKSADQRNPTGEYYLARIYRFEPLRNAAKSIPLYEDSANRGYGLAAFDLGILYEAGDIIPKDDDKSFKWVLRGAELGEKQAQTTIALYYMMGKGTPIDSLAALKWSYVAQANGDPHAKETVKVLEQGHPTLVSVAQKQAKDWWEKHPKSNS